MRRLLLLTTLVLSSLSLLPGGASAATSDWRRSISVYPSSTEDFGSTAFRNTVEYYKTLGFNSITFVIPLRQSTVKSTDVGPTWNTPSGAALKAGIDYVHAQGMAVIFMIHVDPDDGRWRAYIDPADRDSWFFRYSYQLYKYAALAERNGVEAYSLGAEIISMTTDVSHPGNAAQWRKIIAQVRSIYTGKVFYNATRGSDNFNEPAHISFWDALDYIGISAYYALPGDGSVASLKDHWKQIHAEAIDPLYRKYKKPILFSEVGYRSIEGARYHPWESGPLPQPYSGEEQVNNYTALLDYWKDVSYFKGVSVWMAVTDLSRGGPGDRDYFIRGKPVESVFKQYFGAAAPTASVSATGLIAPNSVTLGQSATLNAYVTSNGANLSQTNIDLEVYNSNGTQVFQKIFTGIDLTTDQTRRLIINWTAQAKGTYTLKIGVFSSDWSKLYIWNNDAARLQVN